MFLLSVLLSGLLVPGRTVFGYESVYDIIERRNAGRRYFDEGRYRYPSDFPGVPGFRPYHNFDYKPFGFGRRGTLIFGNGYDNIGNGNIHPGNRLHDFPAGPFRERFRPRYPHYRTPVFYDEKYQPAGRNFNAFGSSSSDSNGKERSGAFKSENIFSNTEDNRERKSSGNYGNNAGSYLNKAIENENFGGKYRADKNGEAKTTLQSNKVRKKGHVTKGFSTHHHKDETGNSTTFYDQSLDHGDQSDFKDFADEFGTKANVDQYGSFQDGKFFTESGGKTQNYDREFAKDEQKREEDILNEENFGKEENFNIVNGDKWPLPPSGANPFPFPIHHY